MPTHRMQDTFPKSVLRFLVWKPPSPGLHMCTDVCMYVRTHAPTYVHICVYLQYLVWHLKYVDKGSTLAIGSPSDSCFKTLDPYSETGVSTGGRPRDCGWLNIAAARVFAHFGLRIPRTMQLGRGFWYEPTGNVNLWGTTVALRCHPST